MTNLLSPIYQNEEKIKALRLEFENAKPCNHLGLDNFLNDEFATSLYDNFPKIDNLQVKRKSLNETKAEDYHFDRFHPAFSQLKEFVQSESFSEFIGKITGIENMYVPSGSYGSGVHQGANGSYVDVHIDYNVSTEHNAWRRINLLIYLNKNWQDGYGGDLELWDKGMTTCMAKYPPLFNRAIIFYTDDNSPHGYSKIDVPEGESRKSFYTYFYTDLEEGVEYRDSKFFAKPDDTMSKRIATKVKEGLKIRIKKMMYKMGIKSLDFQDKNEDKKTQ